VAYDQKQALAPPISEKGLFFATPPGHKPGGVPCDLCFCLCCKIEQKIKTLSPVTMENGRTALSGRCPDCKTEIIRFGGKRALAENLISVTKEALRLTSSASPHLDLDLDLDLDFDSY